MNRGFTNNQKLQIDHILLNMMLTYIASILKRNIIKLP